MRAKDLTGQVFGWLHVTALFRRTGKTTYWNCRCMCGTEKVIERSCLTTGKTVSCGCYGKLARAKTREIQQLKRIIAAQEKLLDDMKSENAALSLLVAGLRQSITKRGGFNLQVQHPQS